MTAPLDLVLRPMGDADRGLVINSWLRSYAQRSRDARDYAGPAQGQFMADYTPVVLALIARSQVLIAALAEEPDAVVAWMAIEGDVLHYVLVKPKWRELGVARWMLEDFAKLPLVYTHQTSLALKCPIPSGWAYRRFRIWPATQEAA